MIQVDSHFPVKEAETHWKGLPWKLWQYETCFWGKIRDGVVYMVWVWKIMHWLFLVLLWPFCSAHLIDFKCAEKVIRNTRLCLAILVNSSGNTGEILRLPGNTSNSSVQCGLPPSAFRLYLIESNACPIKLANPKPWRSLISPTYLSCLLRTTVSPVCALHSTRWVSRKCRASRSRFLFHLCSHWHSVQILCAEFASSSCACSPVSSHSTKKCMLGELAMCVNASVRVVRHFVLTVRYAEEKGLKILLFFFFLQ